jgi:hypothetical protein
VLFVTVRRGIHVGEPWVTDEWTGDREEAHPRSFTAIDLREAPRSDREWRARLWSALKDVFASLSVVNVRLGMANTSLTASRRRARWLYVEARRGLHGEPAARTLAA